MKDNPEVARARVRRYIAAHPGWQLAHTRARATTGYFRDYHRAHPEYHHHPWIGEYRERGLASAQRWRAAHPEIVRANSRISSARRDRRDSNPDLTADQWLALLQVARGRCQYCLKVIEPEEITVDHVEPNKNGGSLTLTNVVPACASCNHGIGGKHAKTVEQWLPPRRALAFRRRHAKLLARIVRGQ